MHGGRATGQLCWCCYDAQRWGSQNLTLIDVHQKAGAELISDLWFVEQAERRRCWERERENGWGRVSTPPTSDLLLSAIQFVFYLQHRGRKRLEGEESRGYKKNKKAGMWSVFCFSLCIQHQAPVRKREEVTKRLQEKVRELGWRKEIRHIQKDINADFRSAMEEKTERGWYRGNLQCHYRATKSSLCAYVLSRSACPLSMPCRLSFDVSFPVPLGGKRPWRHSEFWDATVSRGRS